MCLMEAVRRGRYAVARPWSALFPLSYRQAKVQLELSDRDSWCPSTIVLVDRRRWVEKDLLLEPLGWPVIMAMWSDTPESCLLPGRLVGKAEKFPNTRQLPPPPTDLDSGFHRSPQLLPTASWKPAVSGGRKRTFCCGTSYSPSVWNSVLPISSCLSRRSPDWTCEVPNTVIQAHSLLANCRVSTEEDRSRLKGCGGAPFPISACCSPQTGEGGVILFPTVWPCPQKHTESTCMRAALPAMLQLAISQHQNKHHLIT